MDALAVVQAVIVLTWVAFAVLRLIADERRQAQEERAAVAEVEAQLRALAVQAPMEVDTPTWTLYPHGGAHEGESMPERPPADRSWLRTETIRPMLKPPPSTDPTTPPRTVPARRYTEDACGCEWLIDRSLCGFEASYPTRRCPTHALMEDQ